jgi:hypothetical protein
MPGPERRGGQHMIGRLRTGRTAWRAGSTWRLVAVPVSVLALALGMAVPAIAGTTHHAVPARTIILRTLVGNVVVRSAPRRHARIIGHVGRPGTKIAVSCFATGSPIAGNPVWYRLAAPARGYITSYYTATHVDPVAGVTRCAAGAVFSQPYRTLVRGVHIRALPSSISAIRMTLGRMGAAVAVSCYTMGQDIQGDSVWYHTLAPKKGFVAGLNLNTGSDPVQGVPSCR